jgi:HSP20 family molecular chaperone IbpA
MANAIPSLERAFFAPWPAGRPALFAHLFEDLEPSAPSRLPHGGWTPLNVWDDGKNVVVTAEVPGVEEKDVRITFEKDVLTIAGERRLDAPEGWQLVRRERAGTRFERALRLDVKVDLDGATAVVKNGLLTVTLPKAAETLPRKIQVRTHD